MKYLKKYKIFENKFEEFVDNFTDLMNSLEDADNYKPLIRYYKESKFSTVRDPNGWKDELYFPVEDLSSLQIIFSNKDGKYNIMDFKSLSYLKEYYIDRLYDIIPSNYDILIWINSENSLGNRSNREKVTLSELETIINDLYPEVNRLELFLVVKNSEKEE